MVQFFPMRAFTMMALEMTEPSPMPTGTPSASTFAFCSSGS